MKKRKLVVLAFISLDGVMQSPGAPEEDPSGGFKFGGWTVPFFDKELGTVMGEQMSGPSEYLLGRKTFEIFASYWPDHEDEWAGINTMNKYVLSKTMSGHPWAHTVFLKAVDEIKELTEQDGPNLQVHGSVSLIQTLLAHDLVDELWLKIFPVVLGSGKRLFGDGVIARSFVLKKTLATPAGVVILNYESAKDVKTGSFG